ncbi:MAG: glycoside hydrolase family 88 protein [Microcella sp.]|uniref:glycoside hydrolase family 88 protein n=1 Tax=Microcella sp. TaxID=1913979 RepID=UPI00271EF3C9|nr:glycoside hydrolase family 88 protein [Microcella sp.]MDO8338317.1 glycoside hydrolase family 88 protein [Microcella sp.]
MAGEDLSSSELATPARPPLSSGAFAERQRPLEEALQAATATQGMTRWFWGEGVCLLASLRLADARGEPAPAWVTAFYEPYVRTPPVLEHVNNLAPAAALAEMHRRNPSPQQRRLLDACLRWYQSAPEATRAPNGALEHWPGGVWADTVYMAGQVLLRAGSALDRPELVDEALSQWLAHADLLQHPQSHLLVHGTHAGTRIDCHWGRANAWFALAGADILAATGDARVEERLVALLQAIAERQPEHGVWDVLVDSAPEVRGIIETSAAAGLGAALLRTSRILGPERLGVDMHAELFHAGERAVLGAMAYVESGLLTRVSAGTILQLIPFGYSVIRDDRPQPWGQGLAMEALAAWRETHPG